MSTDPQRLDKHLRVLLVEDNADDASLLERYLRRFGYRATVTRVETETAMREALNSTTETFDVVLADYNLPTFSAPAALRLLKSTDLDIPFIMMSGAVSEDTAVAAMRAGAHDYVSKENLARLLPAIEREMSEATIRGKRRETERALRHMEERFHRLVEAMPIGLLISDSKGRITYANQAVERLLGYSQAEFDSGSVTIDGICTTTSKGLSAPLSEFWLLHGESYEVECRTSAGDTVSVLIGAAVLNPEAPAEDRLVAAFLADLAEQKRSEEVLRRTEKLAAAGRLAASIAHEINNPLESVVNCLYLLTQTALDPLGRQYLSLAQRELDRVIHITTQTLRFYRQSTRPVETHVQELFETVLALYEARIRSFGIHVERKYRTVPAVIAFDGEVRQVLANLVGNAVDAMQVSGGRLILRTAAAYDWVSDRRGVAITVADTGSGMEPSTLNRIFEPFFSTKGITGTGLGLWVSHGIVSKHHGTIRVRSRRRRPASEGDSGDTSGSVFRIFLPFEPSLPTSARTDEAPWLEASA